MFKFNCFLPKIFMKCNKVSFGKNLRLIGYPFIFRFKHSTIKIGDDCIINSNFFSNLIGLYQRTIIIARGGAITIGNNVGISGSTIYSRDSIIIGDNSLIGANCKIIDNDFHPIEAQSRLKNEKNIPIKKIIIGNNCFLGCNVIILKGTKLGDNCVVGAGAIVSGEFPNNSVIAGNPAKVVKTLK